MNRHEFVNELRQNLSDIDDYTFVNDTARYYEDYIETRMRKGEEEAVIMSQLGDPRLIAKSIRASKSLVTNTNSQVNEIDDKPSRKFSFRLLSKLSNLPRPVAKLCVVACVSLAIPIVLMLLQWFFPVLVIAGIVYLVYKSVK